MAALEGEAGAEKKACGGAHGWGGRRRWPAARKEDEEGRKKMLTSGARLAVRKGEGRVWAGGVNGLGPAGWPRGPEREGRGEGRRERKVLGPKWKKEKGPRQKDDLSSFSSRTTTANLSAFLRTKHFSHKNTMQLSMQCNNRGYSL